ncbi:hypothetical protein THAOC_09132, partial [Thalassiosira oceanica]
MWDCPFCRTTTPKTDSQILAMIQARVDRDDPVAMLFLGTLYWHGEIGLEKDTLRAVELYERAAKLGFKPDGNEAGFDDAFTDRKTRKNYRGEKLSPIKRVPGQKGLVFVLTDLSNNPLPLGRATQIDARFKNKLLLPLDPSKGEQTPIVEYALVTNDQLRKIENMAFDEET